MQKNFLPNMLKCFTCGEPGHRQTAYPNATRQGLLAGNVKWDEDGTEDQEEFRVDIMEDRNECDHGNLLMVHRICLTPVRHEEQPWLRTNIFSSTCTIKGKICRYVNDSVVVGM